MLSDFGLLIEMVVELFSIEFTVFGFTFSLWQVFLFSIVADIVIWIVSEVFLGD